MGINQKIDVRIEELGDTDDLKGMWLDLQARARHSFFQSWMWIDCWLRNLPQTHLPKVLIAASAGQVVGLGLFSDRRDHEYGGADRHFSVSSSARQSARRKKAPQPAPTQHSRILLRRIALGWCILENSNPQPPDP